MTFGFNRVFRNASSQKEQFANIEDRATVQGVAIKTIILLAVAMLSALLSLAIVKPLESSTATTIVLVLYILCPILTLILSLVMAFVPKTARFLSIPYSILEGISIGIIGAILSLVMGKTGGMLVGLAFIITIAFFLCATVLYATGVVRVTSGFRKFMYIALLGAVIGSAIVAIVGLFNRGIYEIFYSYGVIATLVSIIMVLLAALYSLITLDNAKKVIDAGLDKAYEWYAAFGIILNIIWLFWEILRLLLIIYNRKK